VWAPLLGALVLQITKKETATKKTALFFSLIPLVLSLVVAFNFNIKANGPQFVEKLTWIKAYGVSYFFGVDGFNVLLLILVSLLVFLAAFASAIPERPKTFFALILILETGLLGVFVALDMILFYVFWETVLIPTYLLINIWGGPNRARAALKFIIYTLVGSVIMLIGMLAIYFKSGLYTFDIIKLSTVSYPLSFQRLAFLALFLGLAVKVPLFPFHGWQPDAYTEAPTTITMLLSGCLAKMGVYGFFRLILPLVPKGAHEFGVYVTALALITVIFGDLVASAQRDLKRMFAYSSLSHMGLMLLGVSCAMTMSIKMGKIAKEGVTTALTGSAIHMFNHGIIAAALFFLIGLIYSRMKTRDVMELRGLLAGVPAIIGLFWYTALASFGFPALSGFPGEIMIIIGTFESKGAWAAILALIGVLVMAGYIFWTLLRIGFGTAPTLKGETKTLDINPAELSVILPLAALILVFGFYSIPLTRAVTWSIHNILILVAR